MKFEKRSHGNADAVVSSYFGEWAVRSGTDERDLIVLECSRQ